MRKGGDSGGRLPTRAARATPDSWPAGSKNTASQNPFTALTMDIGNELVFPSVITGAENFVTLECLGAFS